MSARGRRGRGRGRGNIPIIEEEVSSVGSGGHTAHDAQAGLVAPAPVKFTSLSRDYIHLGGVKFAGTETIIEAQQWLTKIERIFTGLEITDAQKRQLTSWQLHGAAGSWWESVVARVDEDTLTWAQFRFAVIQFPQFPFLVTTSIVYSFCLSFKIGRLLWPSGCPPRARLSFINPLWIFSREICLLPSMRGGSMNSPSSDQD